MNSEYDFSRGQRGKFHSAGAKLNIPVSLDDEVRNFVQSIADNKKSDVSTVVNELLKSDTQLAQVMR